VLKKWERLREISADCPVAYHEDRPKDEIAAGEQQQEPDNNF
jgi:hypothetical protein